MSDSKPKNSSNPGHPSDLNNGSDSINPKPTGNLSSHSENDGDANDLDLSEISIHQSKWSGPLPHPDTLNQYGMIDQSFPERIMALTEREAIHRHDLEKNQVQMIQSDAALMRSERRRGQWMGFVSVLALIVIGSISAFTERESVASVIFGTTILGVVTTFVIGRSRKVQREKTHD